MSKRPHPDGHRGAAAEYGDWIAKRARGNGEDLGATNAPSGRGEGVPGGGNVGHGPANDADGAGTLSGVNRSVGLHEAMQVLLAHAGGSASRLKKRRNHGARVDFRDMIKRHEEEWRRAEPDVSDNGLLQEPTRIVEVSHTPEPVDPVQPVIQGPVCGNCKEAGHRVTGCANVREDGFVHGCSICNSGDHYTHQCSLFDTALEKQVQVLVKNRANLPPLAGRSWYPVMYAYMRKNPFAPVEGLPWTVSFSKRVRSGERRDAVVDIMGSPPRDPRTGSWVAAKRTYGVPVYF
ncbi:hypothetical protein FDECE_4473 [Fusarium decemcellulare]|nr:hypothetical protein FDECE_4473 [Fusarium decemcellulare]